MDDVYVVLDEGAYMPLRGHAEDAGLDLRVPHDVSIKPNDSKVIDTGVRLLIPNGYCGMLMSKSGLYVTEAVTTTGLIDAGFMGTIKVRILNHNKFDELKLSAGDKFTQVVFLKCHRPQLVLAEIQHHDARGEGGYGSTGR